MRPLFAVSLASLALVTVGCGGPGSVSRAEVERQTRQGLTNTVGQQAPPAKCPKPLKAEVGATTRCTMDFPEGKRLGMREGHVGLGRRQARAVRCRGRPGAYGHQVAASVIARNPGLDESSRRMAYWLSMMSVAREPM